MSAETNAADDVAAYRRRLSRAAARRGSAASDPELAALLSTISRRRAGHRDPTDPSTAGPAGSGPAPTDARSQPPVRTSKRSPVRPGAAEGTILSVTDVCATVRLFDVRRPTGLSFRAGQYLKVGVEGAGRRSYSIASAPHDPDLQFCIELVSNGRLTPRLFSLRPGDRLDVGDAAKGRFVLDTRVDTHLMVATVTGIAPLRSMLRDALHRGTAGEFVLLHGASHAEELPFHDEMVQLAATEPRVRYEPTVSRPGSPRNRDWTGHTGRVDVLAAEVAAGLDPAGTRVYACGNSAMVANVSAELGGRRFAVSVETFD